VGNSKKNNKNEKKERKPGPTQTYMDPGSSKHIRDVGLIQDPKP
jgi:hypothetical protein